MSFLSDLQSDFKNMLELKEALGYSRTTYIPYTVDFIEFCGTKFPDSNEISKNMVVEWIDQFEYNSPNTKTRALINLRTFTRYLSSIGKASYVVNDEFSIGIEPYTPVIMTETELKQFFKGVDKTKPTSSCPLKGYILPVLFRMIYCCGLRPAEPLHLLHSDVSLSSGDIYIRQSKHRTDRHIIMSKDLTELCTQYDYIAGDREYFFQRPDGTAFDTQWLGDQFDQCYRNSGLNMPKKPNTYGLRHCFASYNLMKWCTQGKDIMVLLPFLSAYMGHTDIKNTLYYIHLLPERLKQAQFINWEYLDSVYTMEEFGNSGKHRHLSI